MVPAHAGVRRETQAPDRSCTEPHAVRTAHGGRSQRFVFIFNQDYFFLFSYKFASCKQVHKDPSFGEIRVRMNINARRCIYFKMLWRSFSGVQPSAVPQPGRVASPSEDDPYTESKDKRKMSKASGKVKKKKNLFLYKCNFIPHVYLEDTAGGGHWFCFCF